MYILYFSGYNFLNYLPTTLAPLHLALAASSDLTFFGKLRCKVCNKFLLY